jgi:CRISPR-associated protein Cas1
MGRVYYILTDGRLLRDENTLYFENSLGKKALPIEDIEELFILSELSITSKAIKLLAQNSIPLHFFNQYGYYIGSFYPRERNSSGYLIVKQVEHYIEEDKRIYLAKAFVEGAIRNLAFVYSLDPESSLKRLKKAKSPEEVMSIEADFRKKCYEKLEEITGFSFERRTRRPPSNPLNALISFGNSFVYSKVLGEIYFTPLNPTISYLHEPSTKRFSLSLDIAEIFKPILSDKLILKLLKEEKIKEKHFVKSLSMALLNDEGKRIFLSEFNNLLESTVRHKKLKRKVSHRSLIKLELYKLIKHLIGDEIYIPLNYRSLK